MRLPIKVPLSLIACFFILAGWTCIIPQRIRTFLPPTNEKDLCLWDDSFYYNKVHDFCFHYPSDEWKKLSIADSQTVIDSPFTATTFFYNENGENIPIFTVYVAGYGAQSKERMKEEGMTIAYEADPYVIGYIIPPDQDGLVRAYSDQVPKMLETIKVFAPALGRQ